MRSRFETIINHILKYKFLYMLLVLIVIGVLYWGYDINSWKYLFVGDEWPFFDYAKSILKEPQNSFILSFKGVYMKNGVASSYYQALFMLLFGVTNFAWRFSNIALVVPLSVLIYLWVKEVTKKSGIAIIAVFFLVFSASWANYFKNGYINPQASLYYVLSFYLFSKLLKKPSVKKSIMIGITLGIGLYIYIALILPIVLIPYFVAFLVKLKKNALKYIVIIIVVYCLFAFNGFHEILSSPELSLIGASSITTRQFTDNNQIYLNILNNFLLFFKNNDYLYNHFVYGPLMDGVSQVLSVVGFIVVLFSKKPNYYIVLSIYIITGVVLGLTNPYWYTPSTRDYIFLIFGFFFAAVGLYQVIKLSKVKKNRATRYLLLSCIFISIVFINIYMSTYYYFSITGYTQKALLFREIEDNNSSQFVLLKPILETNNYSDINDFLINYGISNKRLVVLPMETFDCWNITSSIGVKFIIFKKDEQEVAADCLNSITIINDKILY